MIPEIEYLETLLTEAIEKLSAATGVLNELVRDKVLPDGIAGDLAVARYSIASTMVKVNAEMDRQRLSVQIDPQPQRTPQRRFGRSL